MSDNWDGITYNQNSEWSDGNDKKVALELARAYLTKCKQLEVALKAIEEIRYAYECVGHHSLTKEALKKFDSATAALGKGGLDEIPKGMITELWSKG